VVDLQQRVAHLEGRVEGHAQMLTDVVGAVRHLEVRMEHRFIGVDLRFTGIEHRLTTLDQKVANLDRKFETGFLWIVGIQFATFIALAAAIFAS